MTWDCNYYQRHIRLGRSLSAYVNVIIPFNGLFRSVGGELEASLCKEVVVAVVENGVLMSMDVCSKWKKEDRIVLSITFFQYLY